MHIYYSVTDPYPAYRADLAELFAVELRKLGLQTEWFMAAPGAQVGNTAVYAGQVVHTPASRPGQSSSAAKIRYLAADLKYLGRLLWRRIDAIQCRDKYLASVAGILVARILGKPFFYWCSYPFPEHGRLVAESKSGWRRWLAIAVAKVRFVVLYKLICRYADHVFVQSQRMQMEMLGYGVRLNKMTPVPMGVSANIVEWRRANPAPTIPLRIVYLGTLAEVRRLDMLLDAFALVRQRFPAAQLLFVGEGDVPTERIALAAKAAELGLTDGVVFTGFVPMTDAWAYAATAAVCLSPFYPNPVLSAASPTKLVEYLALGRPVVCNIHPEQSQIIEASGAGLCVEWRATAFADAIIQLLADPIAAEAMGKNGPAWVAAHRTYPIIAQKVWNKYQSLLIGRRA